MVSAIGSYAVPIASLTAVAQKSESISQAPISLGTGKSLKDKLEGYLVEYAPPDVPPFLDPQSFSVIADNDVSKVWGNIEVNGKVVAQIYQGGIVASNGKYRLPDPEIQGASERAQSIIKTYGGKLVLRDDIKNLQQFFG